MPVISVRIPQIGEGLQEARLVAVLKQPGDRVLRDEPIYQMETDKAVMDVESPYEGILTEWLATPDTVLAIGAEVARMEVSDAPADATAEAPPEAEAPETTAARPSSIPPRTRAYAKEKGVSEETLAQLAAKTSKLMPADIDAFLAQAPMNEAFAEVAMPSKQRVLASRLMRSNQVVVPGTISVAMNWGPIESQRARQKQTGDAFQPSAFTMFAYAVTQALKEHPSFRSSLIGDSTIRTYHHVALGIAVALPGDELVIAVVEDADTLTWPEFAARMRERIEVARTGVDQITEAVTVSLTNMQSFGLRDAIPVVVPPSVATIFLGEVYNGLDPESDEVKLRRTANLAMTFDHRLINGVGAAHFVKAIKDRVEAIAGTLL
ncbi:MAG: 2-oxo acid dehydrogenase subunit E2 [Fimbriimonas sp.]